MNTDIVVEDKKNKKQLIIDTKFYAETLSKRNNSDVEKIRSSHLYQICTYVNNSKYKGEVKGILLYPTIDEDIDVTYPISGYDISIKTVNLNLDWVNIENTLLSILN